MAKHIVQETVWVKGTVSKFRQMNIIKFKTLRMYTHNVTHRYTSQTHTQALNIPDGVS